MKGISEASSNSASYTHQSNFAKIVWSAVTSRDIANTTPGVSRRSEDQISEEIRKKILDGWGLLHLLSEALHEQAGRESIVQDYPRVPRRAEGMSSDQIYTVLQSLLPTISEDKGAQLFLACSKLGTYFSSRNILARPPVCVLLERGLTNRNLPRQMMPALRVQRSLPAVCPSKRSSTPLLCCICSGRV